MNKKNFRKLWYSLSAKQRFWVRYLYYLPADLKDRLKGNRNKYVPPRGAIYTGSAAGAEKFLASSRHQLDLLKSEVDLQPTDRVLDIGSGIGRTAISLVEYLTPEARYEGFDVVKSGVDWCNKKIGRDFPNFNFTYVPLFNDLYNNSKRKATDFEFPYERAQFDKVYSFSVFTHMMVDEIQHYLMEINRVLSDQGQAMSTFFLYDDQNESQIATDEGFGFPVAGDGFRLMNSKVTSGNIAIHKSLLEQMMAKAGLQITQIADGFWKGTQDAKEYQDIVVFKKK
ncbi:class I SAM-dependent methyltransferase [Gilvibacter sp.]|uniref:class I SAM-dependent methyltransferase n=1 Tax=Gilvibacter sp. TaxID=2729997 RepID=UPI0025BFA477|nr:class I SAM-dependent methyltransferase [Gilvibacter sp.]NQX77109.1 class I SAM-dependent methyltransferase [Gilvibacter sp.]